MSLPLSGLSLAALAVTPFIGRQIEDVRSLHWVYASFACLV